MRDVHAKSSSGSRSFNHSLIGVVMQRSSFAKTRRFFATENSPRNDDDLDRAIVSDNLSRNLFQLLLHLKPLPFNVADFACDFALAL
jgi:hypothetical protein